MMIKKLRDFRKAGEYIDTGEGAKAFLGYGQEGGGHPVPPRVCHPPDHGLRKPARPVLDAGNIFFRRNCEGSEKKPRLIEKERNFLGASFWHFQRGNCMFAGALPKNTHTLLKKIFPLIRGREFYLAGGSGLALQMGHRISEDLDFFSRSNFSPSSLVTMLKTKTDRFEEILMESQTLIAALEGVKCSFLFYEVPLIFEAVSWGDIKIADWRDIVAEKFKTVAQRGSKKDFADIFFALQMKKIPLEEAVSIFKKRFQSSGVNLYHILRSLVYFEDADQEPDPRIMEGFEFSWQEVKSFFLHHQREFEKYFFENAPWGQT